MRGPGEALDGKFPAYGTAYLTLALALLPEPEDDYEEVATRVSVLHGN